MTRSVKRRKRQGFARAALAAAGGAVARNPVLVGGGTAFLVAFSFVAANALWYQPMPHRGTFFVTRSLEGYRAPDLDEAELAARRKPAPADPLVLKVQAGLAELDMYQGAADGIAGPRTRQAVEEFQRILGVPVTGRIDQALLDQLRNSAATQPAQSAPAPKPRPATREASDAAAGDPASTVLRWAESQHGQAEVMTVSAETVSSTPRPIGDVRVVRIQAGLKAFGNDGIEIDGMLGPKTKAAIVEFQQLFELPVTGEPDDRLYAKMREVGLTN